MGRYTEDFQKYNYNNEWPAFDEHLNDESETNAEDILIETHTGE